MDVPGPKGHVAYIANAKHIAEINKATDNIPPNVLVRYLFAMDPPKTEPAVPQPDLDIVNPYIPLAHRK